MKVVLAYSGGLDTSVILHWIRETYNAEVIAYTGDVGQGEDELEKARAGAVLTGAADIVVEDLRELLDPRAAAERRTSLGGTAPDQIKRQVGHLREKIAGS